MVSPTDMHPNESEPPKDLSGAGVADQDDGLGARAEYIGESQEQTDELARAMAPIGSQRVVLHEGATKGDAIFITSKQIPQNEYGLPTFFYRSDMLPSLGHLRVGDLDACAVNLDYSDGYPTYGDGSIWWNQLPHEPDSLFQCFVRYLEQADDIGIRQLALLASVQRVGLPIISEASKEYYWRERARAYDLFQVAADRKRREIRARRTEGTHYDTADLLMKALMAKFEDPEWFKDLDAKEAVSVLMDLAKLQRISLGLAANGNAGPASANPDAAMTTEMVFRQLTQNISQSDEGGVTPDLLALMSDPNFTRSAQEVILRVQRGTPIPDTSGAVG